MLLFSFVILFVLGRRVIHSDLTQKKLLEVKKALDMDAMVVAIVLL